MSHEISYSVSYFFYFGSFNPSISHRLSMKSFLTTSCIIVRHFDRNDLFRSNNISLGVIFFSNVVNICSEVILVCLCIEIQRFLGTGAVILSEFAQLLASVSSLFQSSQNSVGLRACDVTGLSRIILRCEITK